jgi:glycosyltransferase involved in cell wall biosynthesis
VRRGILVLCADVVGRRMAGAGIRASELARVLAEDNEVTLLAAAVDGDASAEVKCAVATRSNVAAAVTAADAIVVQGSALHLLDKVDTKRTPVAVDLYDLNVVEDLEIHSTAAASERIDRARNAAAILADQARRGDFFVVASERQRDFVLGALGAHGRLNPLTYDSDRDLRRLVAVVPFGITAGTPKAGGLRGRVPGIAANDKIAVWGGGLWNWFDPITLVRATERLAPDHATLRAVFLGSGHPNPSVPRMRAEIETRRAAEAAGLIGTHVFFMEGWLPYAERGARLADADVGVSLHLPGIETHFAFRTRVLDYLWAGLPMLLTSGDVLAAEAAASGFGVIVEPRDVAAVSDGLRRLLEDDALAASCRRAAQVAAERYRWPTVAAPLRQFCREPRLARDRGLAQDQSPARTRIVRRAWSALRDDGPVRFGRRTVRYLRRRFL